MSVKTSFYNNGSKLTERHFNSKLQLHREDGPARIKYNKDGSIENEEYWVNGEKKK